MDRLHRLVFNLSLVGFSLLGISQAQQYPQSMYQEMSWRMIGPFRGGRTRALAGVPSQANIFYIGAVNGGVWKSDDYGRTWTPIFDQRADTVDRRDCGSPLGSQYYLCGERRGVAPS